MAVLSIAPAPEIMAVAGFAGTIPNPGMDASIMVWLSGGVEIGAVKDRSVRGGLLRASFQLTPEEVSEEVLDGMEAKFGVERDLQLALRANIGQLEEDIRIAHGGKEQVVPSAELTSSPWTHKRCVWSLNSRPAPPTGMRSARFCRRRAGLSICQKGVD